MTDLRFGRMLSGIAIAAVLLGFLPGHQAQARPATLLENAALTTVADRQLSGLRPLSRPTHMIRETVTVETGAPSLRPRAREPFLPHTRWSAKDEGALWTRGAMSAIAAHGTALQEVVPRDIDAWCPAYAQNPPVMRRAFWVGMMSALARHESTLNPQAVGGGNKWFGLLQIYPDTARRYGCGATTGAALTDPVRNLSCAARIMAVTVRRDRAVALNGRGVAADWGPMTDSRKVEEMATWTRAQSYCQPVRGLTESPRPQARPAKDLGPAGERFAFR